MINGKSKIQLFDAVTGKLEHEQTNTNIVTNAVQDLLNDNDPLGLGKLARVYYNNGGAVINAKAFRKLSFLTPLSTVAFGGVLLWDNTITEDPTITMPPDGVHEVGHAGDTYSGSNKYRGTYNSNESGAMENGYRHVWDFGTDRANGEIKCLSLTSKAGGICGYQNDDNSNQESEPPYSYYQFNPDTAYQLFNSSYNYIDFDFDGAVAGAYLYFTKNGDGTFCGLKRNTKDYTKIQQLTFANPTIMTLSKLPNRVTDAKDLITGLNRYAYTYVYDNKIHEIYRSGTSEITHKTYGLDGSPINTVTVHTPQQIYASYYTTQWDRVVFYYNGSYYYNTAQSPCIYRKCSANGDDEGEAFTLPKYEGQYDYALSLFFVDSNGTGMVMLSNTQSSSWQGFCRHIMHLYPNGDYCIFKNNHPGNVGYTNTYYDDRCPALTSFKSPFVYVYNGYANNILLCADSRYLATINNLSEPVVKTSAQVMKVTYEITEGE